MFNESGMMGILEMKIKIVKQTQIFLEIKSVGTTWGDTGVGITPCMCLQERFKLKEEKKKKKPYPDDND